MSDIVNEKNKINKDAIIGALLTQEQLIALIRQELELELLDERKRAFVGLLTDKKPFPDTQADRLFLIEEYDGVKCLRIGNRPYTYRIPLEELKSGWPKLNELAQYKEDKPDQCYACDHKFGRPTKRQPVPDRCPECGEEDPSLRKYNKATGRLR